MLDDLKPIVVDFPYGQDVVIYPISDLHYGSPQFAKKMWSDFTEKVMSEPNSYIVIAGDMLNNALKSSVSNIYEETCRPSEQKRWLAEQLKPLAGKILCGVSGNHERRSEKDSDDNPLCDVFSKIDIEDSYRPNAAFLILRFGHDMIDKRKAKWRPTYTMCVTHGAGGGMLIGSAANKSERFAMAVDNLDVLVSGHTHKPITFPAAKLSIDMQNKQVITKEFTVVTATSWLEYGGYPLQKMMTPVARRLSEIQLSATGKQVRVLQ